MLICCERLTVDDCLGQKSGDVLITREVGGGEGQAGVLVLQETGRT